MSFLTLHNDVLLQVGEHFGVEFPEKATKKTMAAALVESGVTFDMYKEAFPDPFDEPDADVAEENTDAPETPSPASQQAPTVLVKMERANPTFGIRGYVFTKAHPFLPVKEEDAAYILRNEEGFRVALPSEAEEFYS